MENAELQNSGHADYRMTILGYVDCIEVLITDHEITAGQRTFSGVFVRAYLNLYRRNVQV